MCYNCATKLDDYYDFLETCHSSDYKFETLLFAPPPKLILEHTLGGAAPHDGVIVIGKSDEMQSRDCQDILLMVELKNSDESEIIETDAGGGGAGGGVNSGVLRHSHQGDSTYNNSKKSVLSPPTPQKQKKPFPCGSCNKSFMRRFSLNAHLPPIRKYGRTRVLSAIARSPFAGI